MNYYKLNIINFHMIIFYMKSRDVDRGDNQHIQDLFRDVTCLSIIRQMKKKQTPTDFCVCITLDLLFILKVKDTGKSLKTKKVIIESQFYYPNAT